MGGMDYLPWIVYSGLVCLVSMVMSEIDFEWCACLFEVVLVLFVIATCFLLWGNL